jgi:hypothetical protein
MPDGLNGKLAGAVPFLMGRQNQAEISKEPPSDSYILSSMRNWLLAFSAEGE